MTDQLKTLGALTLVAVFLCGSGCTRKPSRVHPPSIDADAAGSAAMEAYDTNKDSKVAGDELLKAPSLKAAIDTLDLDKDKSVSAEEITKRIVAWQDSKRGLTTMIITVTYRNQPLEGAKIVFEPEAFLGENVKPATGTTDQRGMANMTTEGPEKLGVALGLYKVKITKDGMDIPAKYNEQTTLGIEVGPDGGGMEEDIRFDLQ